MAKKVFSFVGLCFIFSSTGVLAGESKKPSENLKVATIEMENRLIDGKKVWLPSSIELKKGLHYKVILKNGLAEPHGFEIPGLTKAVVVNGNENQTLEVNPDKAGKFAFKCHLHPAHVGGDVIVK